MVDVAGICNASCFGGPPHVPQATLKLGESVTVGNPLPSVNGKYRLEMFESESVAHVN